MKRSANSVATYRFDWLATIVLAFLLVAGPSLATSFVGVAKAATVQDTSSVAEMTAAIDAAEASFKEKRFEDSAAKINEAIGALTSILEATNKSDVPEIRKQHRRIVAAQRLLRSAKQQTDRLPRLKFNYVEPSEEMKSTTDSDKILFTQAVAPILADKCGRCHISRRSGDVSLASVSQMVGLIEAGKSDESQLYTVIEDGSMPKGNNKLSDEEKAIVKNWIDQGAKLDGGQLDFDLRPLMQMNRPAPTSNAEVSMATENDTVFFSKDIAPMLVESCSGCHIAAMQVRGGLRMDNFSLLLRGGDSGALIIPGNPEGSLLVQKLKGMGDGQQMPINRPKWNDQQLEKISTWIREGARYDSPDAGTPLADLVSLSKVAAMDSEALTQHRVNVAKDQWDLALVGVQNETQTTESFHYVFGYGVKSETKKAILAEADRLYQEFTPELLGNDAPVFSKAPITIFVPKSGYDYSEFAKMVEKREADLNEKFHWDRTVDGPYLVLRGSLKPEEVTEALQQTLPAAMVASWQPNLPKWFCDSVGSSVVKWDSNQLKQVAAYLSQNVPNNNSIRQWVTDRLAMHQAYDIVAGMGWRRSKPQLKKLRTDLWKGQAFTTTLQKNFQGSPEEIATALLQLGMK